jgi:heme-degrading monooxygenase HmoA
MLIRIVRMTFRAEEVPTFLELFWQKYPLISTYPGVKALTLQKDARELNVYYTHSVWEDETYLEDYRHSALFADIWGKTKPLFAEKAKAYSLIEVQQEKL